MYLKILSRLEKQKLALDVRRVVVDWRRGNQNNFLAVTNLVQLAETLRGLAAEAMRFVDENVLELLHAVFKNFIRLAERFDFCRDAELKQHAKATARRANH